MKYIHGLRHVDGISRATAMLQLANRILQSALQIGATRVVMKAPADYTMEKAILKANSIVRKKKTILRTLTRFCRRVSLGDNDRTAGGDVYRSPAERVASTAHGAGVAFRAQGESDQ